MAQYDLNLQFTLNDKISKSLVRIEKSLKKLNQVTDKLAKNIGNQRTSFDKLSQAVGKTTNKINATTDAMNRGSAGTNRMSRGLNKVTRDTKKAEGGFFKLHKIVQKFTTFLSSVAVGFVISRFVQRVAIQPLVDEAAGWHKAFAFGATDEQVAAGTAFGRRQARSRIGVSSGEFGVGWAKTLSALPELSGDVKSLNEITRRMVVGGRASGMTDRSGNLDMEKVGDVFAQLYKITKGGEFAKHSPVKAMEEITNVFAATTEVFNVDGQKLQTSFRSVGSSATLLGETLADQMAVIGHLTEQIGAERAGTGLREAVSRGASAQSKLNRMGYHNIDLTSGSYLDAAREIKRVFMDDDGKIDLDEIRRITSAYGQTGGMAIIETARGLASITAKSAELTKLQKDTINTEKKAKKSSSGFHITIQTIARQFNALYLTIGSFLQPHLFKFASWLQTLNADGFPGLKEWIDKMVPVAVDLYKMFKDLFTLGLPGFKKGLASVSDYFTVFGKIIELTLKPIIYVIKVLQEFGQKIVGFVLDKFGIKLGSEADRESTQRAIKNLELLGLTDAGRQAGNSTAQATAQPTKVEVSFNLNGDNDTGVQISEELVAQMEQRLMETLNSNFGSPQAV